MRISSAAALRTATASALALAAVLTAMAATGNGFAAKSMPSTSENVTLDTLKACKPYTAADDVDMEYLRDCLAVRLESLAVSSGLEAADALAVGLHGQPFLQEACHEAGHAVGRNQYSELPSLAAAAAMRLEACDAGFLHGVFDEAAVRNPSTEEKLAAVAACDASTGNGWCADAIGHLIWTSDPDFSRAVDACSRFTDDNKARSCQEGVFMRMVEPQKDARTRAYSVAEIRELCSSKWPGVRVSMQESCGTGVSLAEYLRTITPSAPAMRDSSGRPILTEVRATLQKALRSCDDLYGSFTPTKCRIALVWDTARRPGMTDDVAIIGCALLPRAEHEACADGQVDMDAAPIIPLERIREEAATAS